MTRVAHGLFGKIPTKGDFVHRNLPQGFVRRWDQWLSGALAASREKLGDAWLPSYLEAPPWRFVVDSGVAGPSSWLGILVSSADQVQRFFPLTLAIALPPAIPLTALHCDFEPLLERLENIALGLAGGDLLLDDVAGALESLAGAIDDRARSRPPRLYWTDRRATAWLGEAPGPSVATMVAEATPEGSGELSCWWHRPWGERTPARIVVRGLPPIEGFAAFLDSRWTAHGWAADHG